MVVKLATPMTQHEIISCIKMCKFDLHFYSIWLILICEK